jgi:AraC family transcriptional regulator
VLRRARLRRAADAVGRTRATISTIAYETAFADEPHLCRAFTRATGVTPGRYRRLVELVARMPAST